MLRRNRIILEELQLWYKENKIDRKTFEKLSEKYVNNEEDVDSIMRWSVIVGIVLMLIGLFFLGVYIIESLYTVIGALSLVVGIGFYLGFKFVKKTGKYYYPKTGSTIIIVSSLILVTDTYFMLLKLNLNYKLSLSLVLFFWSFVYVFIAYYKSKRLFLMMADTGIILFTISFTNFFYKENMFYEHKMTYLMLFFIGLLLILTAYLHNYIKYRLNLKYKKIHYFFALLVLNLSLFALSLCGECSEKIINVKTYEREKSIIILLWAFICILLYFIGKKYNNKIFKIQAVFFLLVNVYIRYFEFFWSKMNKSLFFIVLGILSTAIGVYFENIYRKRWS